MTLDYAKSNFVGEGFATETYMRALTQ